MYATIPEEGSKVWKNLQKKAKPIICMEKCIKGVHVQVVQAKAFKTMQIYVIIWRKKRKENIRVS